MKAVMISIQPKWCELIESGKKTIEVRKTKPKLDTPFKCYIYQTKKPICVLFSGNGRHISEYDKEMCYKHGSGKVIGEFVCRECETVVPERYPFDQTGTCLTPLQIMNYGGNKEIYYWHISDLVIYDKPKKLSEFIKPCKYGDESDASCFLCDKSGYAPDMHIDCFNTVTRPPQSWCYVEDMKGEDLG